VQLEFANKPSAGGDVPSSDSSGWFSADRVYDPDPHLVSRSPQEKKIKITVDLFGYLEYYMLLYTSNQNSIS
jgi:hypothetical protein